MKKMISASVVAATLFGSFAAFAGDPNDVGCPQGQEEFIGYVVAVKNSDCNTKWAINNEGQSIVALNLPAQFQRDRMTVYGCYVPVKNVVPCKVDGKDAEVVTLSQIHPSYE